jgi:hypothetical protein
LFEAAVKNASSGRSAGGDYGTKLRDLAAIAR